jgi:hypothetical protein
MNMHVCISTYIHVHMYLYIYIYIHLYTYIHINVYVYVLIHIYVNIERDINIHIYLEIGVYMHLHIKSISILIGQSMEGYRKAWENISDKLESKKNLYAFNTENKYMNNTGEKISDTDHFAAGMESFEAGRIKEAVLAFEVLFIYMCHRCVFLYGHIYMYI